MKDAEYYSTVMIILIVENAILRNARYGECHSATLLKCVRKMRADGDLNEAHHCHRL